MPAGDEKIDPSIVVEIEKPRAPFHVGIAGSSHACFPTDVVKARGAQIVVEAIPLVHEVGDEDVEPAIVIVIAEVHAHRSFGVSFGA